MSEHWGDQIGMRLPVTIYHSSVASNASDGGVTEGRFAIPTLPTGKTAKLVGAKWIPVSSQAGSATNYRDLKVVNLGQAAAGTAVMASHTLSATGASVAASVAQALTMTTATASVSATSGDVIELQTISAGNGIAIVAGCIQFEWQIT